LDNFVLLHHKAIEKYCNNRIKSGYRYLFWENNKTEFDFMNYTKIVEWKIKQGNDIFKELFTKVRF
jgi:hypothetical protein